MLQVDVLNTEFLQLRVFMKIEDKYFEIDLQLTVDILFQMGIQLFCQCVTPIKHCIELWLNKVNIVLFVKIYPLHLIICGKLHTY